ncbi:hypothetical protein DL762_004097 [Monosporascus cannonballus]|uniref:Uncharacterized protein n=1 Tax=Monosporascus cannonballus TaxID=155416 RepID=A0ABY0H8N3_9PEZI|nr:hypothetical protein DL762_004097 [Monosporascus cannonballus]
MGVAARAERVRVRRRRLQPHVLLVERGESLRHRPARFCHFAEGKAASSWRAATRACCSAPSCATAYGPGGVTVRLVGGACVEARFTVWTFSVGVLQSEEPVTFDPPLPLWKREAPEQLQMGHLHQDLHADRVPGQGDPGANALHVSPMERGRKRTDRQVGLRIVQQLAREDGAGEAPEPARTWAGCTSPARAPRRSTSASCRGPWFEGCDAGLHIAAGLPQQREEETGECKCERGGPAANTTTARVGGYGGSVEMEMRHYKPLRGRRVSMRTTVVAGGRRAASSMRRND